MNFEFIHKSGEKRTVVITEKEIQSLLEYNLYEKIMECSCEPVGETNVVECNCEDYLDGFELQERK